MKVWFCFLGIVGHLIGHTYAYYELCNATHFKCRSQRGFLRSPCVSIGSVCNGNDDCNRGEDEQISLCDNPSGKCPIDGHFKCGQTDICIPYDQVCDGVRNCPDRQDETSSLCANPFSKCETGQFKCGFTTVCIDKSKICDGIRNCPRGEDEPITEVCLSKMCHKENGQCAHDCDHFAYTLGSRCQCANGYRLVNETQCQDIDECATFGTCEHYCKNVPGSYECYCQVGYELVSASPFEKVKSKCRSEEKGAALFVCRGDKIVKIRLEDRDYSYNVSEVVGNVDNVTTVDYHYQGGYVFWSERVGLRNRMYRAPLNHHRQGSDWSKLVDQLDFKISGNNSGLAVDWIYNHIYWIESSKRAIILSQMDGSFHKTLLDGFAQSPNAIVVNPIRGWLFWSRPSGIERSLLDGSGRTVLLDNGPTSWVIGLTLDYVLERVYWLDKASHTISTCTFDGQDRRLIVTSPTLLSNPSSIATFESWLYWSNIDTATVYKANKFDGNDSASFYTFRPWNSPRGLILYHPYKQPLSPNHCTAIKAFLQCSHFCLFTPDELQSKKVTCDCPDGMVSLDSVNCVPANSKIRQQTRNFQTTSSMSIPQTTQMTNANSSVPVADTTSKSSRQSDQIESRNETNMKSNDSDSLPLASTVTFSSTSVPSEVANAVKRNQQSSSFWMIIVVILVLLCIIISVLYNIYLRAKIPSENNTDHLSKVHFRMSTSEEHCSSDGNSHEIATML